MAIKGGKIMLNRVVLIGRLTKEPENRFTQGGTSELWCRMRRIEAVGLSQFGKTIFLTREEAEKALEKEQ
jgi:single-stranded DNA-binding protein